MPHDKHGNTLERGDTVTVAFTITEIHPSDDFCLASLLSVEPMHPGTDYPSRAPLTINTRQCELQTKGRPDLPMTIEPCEPCHDPV